MAVKLRMTRIGRRHRPFFRINAVESRRPRDGEILEKLGHYDPIAKDKDKQIVLNTERVRYWLDKGAIPSDTVSQILLRLGIKHKYAGEKTARRAKARVAAHAKGRLFTKTETIAAEKAAAAAKEAEEKEKAEQAKAKADAEAKEKTEAKAEVIEIEAEVKTPEAAKEAEVEAKGKDEAKARAKAKPKAKEKAEAKEESEAQSEPQAPKGQAKEQQAASGDEDKKQ